MKKVILLCFACSFLSASLWSQQSIQYQLNGKGMFSSRQATVQGTLNYTSYGAWDQTGDYKKFSGTVYVNNRGYKFTYEGYSNLAPYEGYIYLPQGTLKIQVLDNSSGMMYINDGRPTLKAPDEYGRFNIQWTRR